MHEAEPRVGAVPKQGCLAECLAPGRGQRSSWWKWPHSLQVGTFLSALEW